ncbi:hypothetical protein CI238_02183 [Colletotrichum incanum]|uniref:Uncharacterized protein n=1 Tax=Colletotrichum incanum TaxID=1573173 RepID=A0A162PCW0_COLIC|nr:hypothetical protein CI238_02183 [Colletotrichum incanum]
MPRRRWKRGRRCPIPNASIAKCRRASKMAAGDVTSGKDQLRQRSTGARTGCILLVQWQTGKVSRDVQPYYYTRDEAFKSTGVVYYVPYTAAKGTPHYNQQHEGTFDHIR